MEIQQLNENEFLIRIEPEEKLMASLEMFMQDNRFGYVSFEIFTGGGLVDIECSFSEKYGSKEYKFAGPMELGGAGGNIAWDRNNPNTSLVHCHVCLGDEEGLKGYVAHLKETTVKLTVEMKATVYKEKVFRKIDERVGLMLLDLPKYTGKIQTSKPNDKGGNQQGQSEEVERLKKELEEAKKKIKDLRELNIELNETNVKLLNERIVQIEIPPKG